MGTFLLIIVVIVAAVVILNRLGHSLAPQSGDGAAGQPSSRTAPQMSADDPDRLQADEEERHLLNMAAGNRNVIARLCAEEQSKHPEASRLMVLRQVRQRWLEDHNNRWH